MSALSCLQRFQACGRDVVALDLDLRVTSFDRCMPYRCKSGADKADKHRPLEAVAGALGAGTANNTRDRRGPHRYLVGGLCCDGQIQFA